MLSSLVIGGSLGGSPGMHLHLWREYVTQEYGWQESERILNDAETKLRALLARQNNTLQTGGQSTGESRKSHAPRRTRTPSLLIRSQALYPVELWARVGGTRLELVTSTMSTWRSNQLS